MDAGAENILVYMMSSTDPVLEAIQLKGTGISFSIEEQIFAVL